MGRVAGGRMHAGRRRRTFFQRLLDLLCVMGRFHILVSGKRMTSAITCLFR